MSTATARTIRCEGCRSSFSIESVTATVVCPYCGHQQAVEEHEQLQQYQANVARQVARADEQELVASAIEAWNQSRSSDPKTNLAMVYGLMLGLPFALALLLLAANTLGLVPKDSGPGLALAIGATSYLGLGAYLVWYATGRRKREERVTALAPRRIVCPSCGAPSELAPGRAVENCSYCGAALIPSRTMMQQGVDAAVMARRDAALRRQQAQRLASAKARDLGPFATLMPVVMIGSFVLMIGGSAVGFSIEMLRGHEPFHPAIFLLWAMALALVGGVLAYLSGRRNRLEALQRSVEDLTTQFQGERLPDIHAKVDWLNRYWPATCEPSVMGQTYLACAATVEVGGFGALIDVDLNASRPPPRLHLMLAAWSPEQSDQPSRSKRVKNKELSQLGYVVRATAGGLIAMAQKPLLDACREDPSTIHTVAPALTKLAALAQERGYRPVPTSS